MKIAKSSNMGSNNGSSRIHVNDPIKLILALDNDVSKLFQLAQGRVRLGTGTDGDRGENISGEFQVVSNTGTANTEFAITHTVGSVPVGFMVLKNSVNGNVYNGTSAWTDTTIYLRHSGANANITVFLFK